MERLPDATQASALLGSRSSTRSSHECASGEFALLEETVRLPQASSMALPERRAGVLGAGLADEGAWVEATGSCDAEARESGGCGRALENGAKTSSNDRECRAGPRWTRWRTTLLNIQPLARTC